MGGKARLKSSIKKFQPHLIIIINGHYFQGGTWDIVTIMLGTNDAKDPGVCAVAIAAVAAIAMATVVTVATAVPTATILAQAAIYDD